MPLYEYRCDQCHALSTVLVRSQSTASAPVCRTCGSSSLTKLVSRFAVHRSWGDSLNWSPSGETMGDLDEDDPGSLDRYMGRLQDEMGGEVSPDFEEMRRELSTGHHGHGHSHFDDDDFSDDV